jgi:hypothetical protein
MEEKNLLKYNRHWEKTFNYPFPKKREIFALLLKSLEKRQIVELIGLRRTGKTTLLFQIINYLLARHTNPFSIWYFTFDEEKIKLTELFQNFSRQTQSDFKKEKIYIFLDEIQKLPDFQNQLKVYYDLYPNLKFFISGSTSLFIKKKTQESLVGRIISFSLSPLNFSEYLYFKEKTEILRKPLVFKNEIEKEFEIFLESQFIESILIKETNERKDYFISIMKKIIFEDIPQIFPVENPEILWRILKIVAQNPGILIDYQGFSKEVGISNKTLSAYFFYLEEAFLVKKIYNFSRNLITSEKKLKKFYLVSPSFSWALTDFMDKGKLAENFVLSLKNYKFFWRDPYKHEIDFVEVENKGIIPVEVKYKEDIREKELRNFLFFSKRFKQKKAILLKKTLEEKKIKIKNLEIKETPIYFI